MVLINKSKTWCSMRLLQNIHLNVLLGVVLCSTSVGSRDGNLSKDEISINPRTSKHIEVHRESSKARTCTPITFLVSKIIFLISRIDFLSSKSCTPIYSLYIFSLKACSIWIESV
jgi:hypothetical protein